MLYWHRLIAISGIVLLLFVVVTGAGIQLSDMRALLTHAPATDPDMLMMRQHIFGTSDFVVVAPSDYTAETLPATLDYPAALRKTAVFGHVAAPGEPLKLVEVRMVRGAVAGHVQAGGQHFLFDLADGHRLPEADIPMSVSNEVPGSTRMWFKKLHQMRFAGPLGSLLSGVAGLCLAGLILTGLWQYYRLLHRRRTMGRAAMFWRGGGTWRELHRAVSVGAGAVLIWIAGTGLIVAVDDIGGSIARMSRPPLPRGASGPDLSSPLTDSELSGMARTSLAAFRQVSPGTGVRVLRLRNYAGYSQGIVIAADAGTSQLVFNAATGAAMTMQEPGYPNSGFPYGWEWHQRVKRLHRGDFFGMTGRWLVTLGGLSLLYLSISGPIMYWQMWRRRQASGRRALAWR